MNEKEKIILKDGTELEIENGATENRIQVIIQDLNEFKKLYDNFNMNNLESYQIKNVEGLICTTRTNKFLKNVIIEQMENFFLISFNLENVDMTNKRLSALEEGQEIQDGAINDLGITINEIADGGI